MKSLAMLSGNNHNITLEKNNILLNNEHFRTVLGCCNAERLSLVSRTGADDKLTQLAPSGFIFFSASQHDFATVLFFFLYILKKKSNLFNISTAEADRFRNNMSHANMYYAIGPKPSPTYAHTELFNIIKFHFFFFFLTIFFPSISFDFSSRATFPCATTGKVSSTVPLCTAEPNHGEEASKNLPLLKLSLICFTAV